jgi:hypothetical protein
MRGKDEQQLDAWLGKESGKPVHAASETQDLTAELKRGLSYIRHDHHGNEHWWVLVRTRKCNDG